MFHPCPIGPASFRGTPALPSLIVAHEPVGVKRKKVCYRPIASMSDVMRQASGKRPCMLSRVPLCDPEIVYREQLLMAECPPSL